MARDVTLSEQNRQLLQEVKRRTNQMAAINVVTSVVGQSLDIDKTLETALEIALEIVDAEASGISLIDEDAGELVLRAQRGWIHDFVVSNPMRIPLGEGMSGQVVEKDDVVVYNTLTGTEDYAVPSFRDEHFRSIAMAPMHARGRIIGILSIMSNEPHSFDDEIVAVLRVVADTVGVALENARLFSQSIEERERIEAVLHSTSDGILATDKSSKIKLANQAAERLLGVTRTQLIDVPLREAPINWHIRNQLLRALASRERGEDKAFQATLGDDRVIAVVVNPILADSGFEKVVEQDGWVIVLKDVTHLRRAEIARAEFMQAASHDMRNPLSVAYSSIITLDKILIERDEDLDEVIDLALDGLERLRSLIDDLLHLEHIESGYNFRVRPFNLLDVLQEVINESADRQVTTHLTLDFQVNSDVSVLHADVRWFKLAVHHYLMNAAKVTPENGTIKLRVQDHDEMLVIEVHDDGPGIPVPAQARVFDRFYRVEGDKAQGSGLGLAIAQSVAVAHGGAVYLRSEVDKGSVFGLKFPLNPPEEIRRDISTEHD